MSTRRQILQQAALVTGAAAFIQAQSAPTTSPDPAWKRFFPAGFRNERIKTSGAEINGVIGGSGPRC